MSKSTKNGTLISKASPFLSLVLAIGLSVSLSMCIVLTFTYSEAYEGEENPRYEKGHELLLGGEYELAYEALIGIAKKGNAPAQCLLGVMYYGGLYVDQNTGEAKKWLKMSIDKNYANAKHHLAMVYLDAKEYEKTHELLVSSLDDGYIMSLHPLGELYFYGKGVGVDYCIAREYFEKSSKYNYAKSFFFLSSISLEGLCGDPDPELAFKYAFRAANGGDKLGQSLLGMFYEKGIVVDKDCREAIKWYQLSYNNGLPDALVNLNDAQKTCR